MSTEQNRSFFKNLPDAVLSLLDIVSKEGFEILAIGGAVRDFYLGKTLGEITDFDFELRPRGNFKPSLRELSDNLACKYQVENLPYEIIRVKVGKLECEFSLPRIEKYNDQFHHKNFDVQYIPDEKYSLGHQRRDFTINAIGIKLNSNYRDELIDPLKGLRDLKQRILRPCSSDFFSDPVRFLRAIRFSLKLNFALDPTIGHEFTKLKVSDFPTYYLKSESIKSQRALSFFKALSTFCGDDFSDHVLIPSFEEKFLRQDLSFLKFAFFLDTNSKDLLSQMMQVKFDSIPALPWKIDNYSLYQKISKLPDEIIDFYYTHKLLNFSSFDFVKFNAIAVDLSGIAPQERGQYQFKHRLKNFVKSSS